MIPQSKRKETPFETRDHMLNIWIHVTELSFRGFGKYKRKSPKTPKNFDEWSQESRDKYIEKEKIRLEYQEQWDLMFINRESTVVDDLCRRIVQVIDQANSFNPQLVCEFDKQRLLHDEAIGLCGNLERELNHIADTIPCNKNFLAKLTEDIDKEITLLRGWRKSFNAARKKAVIKEIELRKTAAEKLGFIFDFDNLGIASSDNEEIM